MLRKTFQSAASTELHFDDSSSDKLGSSSQPAASTKPRSNVSPLDTLRSLQVTASPKPRSDASSADTVRSTSHSDASVEPSDASSPAKSVKPRSDASAKPSDTSSSHKKRKLEQDSRPSRPKRLKIKPVKYFAQDVSIDSDSSVFAVESDMEEEDESGMEIPDSCADDEHLSEALSQPSTPIPPRLASKPVSMAQQLSRTAPRLLGDQDGVAYFVCPVLSCTKESNPDVQVDKFYNHTSSHARELFHMDHLPCQFGWSMGFVDEFIRFADYSKGICTDIPPRSHPRKCSLCPYHKDIASAAPMNAHWLRSHVE
jgi:hypothetical protein